MKIIFMGEDNEAIFDATVRIIHSSRLSNG